MQDKDEQLLKKRISELAALCYQRDIRSYTDFLTLNEQTIFHSMKRTLPPVTWLMGGGYETAERKIVCFLPSYEDETADLPISILEAVPASPRFAEALTHRDFLGAIMNLGISRSCIGDILMNENGCFIFCLEKMAPFLIQELKMVRHTQVSCRPATQAPAAAPNCETVSGSVASPRLDSVISLVFKTSRSKTLPFIEGERVFIDGRLCISPGRQLKEGEHYIGPRPRQVPLYRRRKSDKERAPFRQCRKIYIVRKYMPKVTIRFWPLNMGFSLKIRVKTPRGIAAVTVTAQIRIRRNDYEWQKYI